MIRNIKQKYIAQLRVRLLEEQQWNCPICDKPIEHPVLDHHHIKRVKGTGLIRGVLCRSCNILLGKVENNCVRYNITQEELPQVLLNMSVYLTKPHLPYKHPSEKQRQILTKSSYNKLKRVVLNQTQVPPYPKSGKLTKKLASLFLKYNVEPTYYK